MSSAVLSRPDAQQEESRGARLAQVLQQPLLDRIAATYDRDVIGKSYLGVLGQAS